MDQKNQAADLWKQAAVGSRIQSLFSHKAFALEHLVLGLLVPFCVFVTFRTQIGIAWLGDKYLPMTVAGVFVSWMWFVDSRNHGNYFLMKWIAHFATAYILATSVNMDKWVFR